MIEPFFSRDRVDEILGAEAAARVHAIDHGLMDYGRHHVWHGGRQWFTVAGVDLLVEQLRGDHAAAAMALQRESAREQARLSSANAAVAAPNETPWWQKGPMA